MRLNNKNKHHVFQTTAVLVYDVYIPAFGVDFADESAILPAEQGVRKAATQVSNSSLVSLCMRKSTPQASQSVQRRVSARPLNSANGFI